MILLIRQRLLESLFFHRALQWMLVTAGKIHDLSHFGFCDLVAEHANNGDAFFMNGQHDFERLSVGHAKEPFEDMHHEFHRRVVVVQKQHSIQRWSFGARTGFGGDANVTLIIVVFVIGHAQRLQSHLEFYPVFSR